MKVLDSLTIELLGRGKSGECTVRTSKVSAPVHEAYTELLGFRRVSEVDRPARVKRSVNAKVGPKPFPPNTQSTD